MVDFLNKNPIIIGIAFTVLFGFELWALAFRYDHFLKLIRRKQYLSLFIAIPESRTVAISATLMLFVAGLAIIATELGIFSRRFWFVTLAMCVLNCFGLMARHKWQKWRNRKRH
ncbi:MAG: hypothetical protein ACKVZH_03460 [Blastocatellia bacterium]